MRKIFRIFGLGLSAALIGCGGGGGSAGGGTSGDGKKPVVNATSVEVLASASELRSADSNGITITAVAKDSANNAIANQQISFKASSGTLSEVISVSDVGGKATAILTAGVDRANRTIKITVTAGSASSSIDIPVTGTTLSVAGATSLIKGSGASYAASLKDSSGNPIEGFSLNVLSTLNNTISPASIKTDATGAAAFAYKAVNNGSDLLTFSGGGASQVLTVGVSSQDFTFASPIAGAEVSVNQDQMVTIQFLSNGVGVAGTNISFGTTRGTVTPSLVVTDSAGKASVIVNSGSAGKAIVSAQIDGGTTNALPLNFVASVPSTVVLQASSAALAPNVAVGSTINQAELRAMVRDVAGNPVKGRTVFFTVVNDLSSGSIKTGSAVTDANGVASDFFIAGASVTAANGVKLRATVANTSIVSEIDLTVSGRALFIAIASNNTIEKLATTYKKIFSVQVNDANGAPVAGQNVSLSYWVPNYRKGIMIFSGVMSSAPNGSTIEVDKRWRIDESTVFNDCENEDKNRNGILDPTEDKNNDGKLNPGLPAVIAPASVVTDSSGFAEFSVTYGQQYALWFDIDLTARAMVSGTESSGSYWLTAPILSADLDDGAVSPAGRVSPFGKKNCTSAN